jgi:UDP-N-acetylmuramyl pentapeptide synthase
MKNDIFDRTNPFTVPEGYFDALHERLISRVRAEADCPKAERRIAGLRAFMLPVAAAACILLAVAGAALHALRTSGVRPAMAEASLDDDFYQWFYTSDGVTLLSESLNANMPESVAADEAVSSEEDDAIIRFLERANINVAAIVLSMNGETLPVP